jgi:pyridoxamine-phosphate oxidase
VSHHWIPLDEENVQESPFKQFDAWFDDAQGVMLDREAVCLSTATPSGVPSSRMVLLRRHDGTMFGWYTNYESRKGGELAANAHAALLWYCEGLGRQIRIEGTVERMTNEESDVYFATRARGSQLGAHASHQSTTLVSREALEDTVREVDAEFFGRDVPRPRYWGGFLLRPVRFEFWQHRDDRLHDRIVYVKLGDTWERERQAP